MQVNAPLHTRLRNDHQDVSLDELQGMVLRAPTIVWLSDGGVLATCANVACPRGCSTHHGAAVAVRSHRPGRSGEVQVPRGVRGAQIFGAPVSVAPVLLPSTVGTLLAELHPALQMHLRGHHGDLAL